MDMDKPDGQARPGVANIVAAVALVTVVLGYVVYLNSGPADVRSELPRSASSAPGTEGGSASGNAAGAASNSSSQQRAANAGEAASPSADNKPTEPVAGAPQNSQSKPASLSANDIAYVQKRHANIRSEPRDRGPLAGRAYKGTKLSVVSRSGKWVQVESGETKGWVSAKLIGPRLP